jgi:hypothetical protein
MPVESHLTNDCGCQLSRIGTPELAAVVVLAVLGLGLICWIINSPDRCGRVNRILLAGRGDASCLQPRTSVRRSSDSRPRSIEAISAK